MSRGIVYKIISKKRIAELNSGELPEDAVFEALKSGELNHARCEDFRFTSWGTENIHVKNFVWKRGKFRGEFTDCIFSDGEISEVDFWDSDFKNVSFRNVSFTKSEINSSYSDRFIFELNNVVFENCTFHRFTIGQAINSKIFLKNCQMMNSKFYLKSSCIIFHKCSTKNGKFIGAICIGIFDSINLEPIKVQDCLFFCLRLIGDVIDVLNISAKNVGLDLSYRIKIKNLVIHCKRFDLDTTCENSSQLDEIKERYELGTLPARVLDNVNIVCSKGGVFGIIGFSINTLKIAMTEERPESESAICYCEIKNLEMVGFKTDGLMISESTIQKANFKFCHFNELELSDCSILDLTLNLFKISKKMILNKTKIGHLSIDTVLLDKKAGWETELSAVGVLNKPNSNEKEMKNVSGQRLLSYFDRADIEPSK